MSKTNNMAAIAVSKSLLKEYVTSECLRTVYLNDGDEFQIKLFNPESVRISAKIYIDGQYLGNDLILRPGEACWLERYLDKTKKFRFDTYEVAANNEAVDRAILENGKIEIKFYREKPKKTNPIIIPSVYYGKGIGTGDVCVNDTYTVSTSDISYSTSANLNATTYSSCSTSPKATLDWIQQETKETGRVAEGGYSNQRFKVMNVDIEEWAFRTEVIKILPRSQKPFTKNDLNKVYCTSCGRKIKPKFKYCPFCGEKQD